MLHKPFTTVNLVSVSMLLWCIPAAAVTKLAKMLVVANGIDLFISGLTTGTFELQYIIIFCDSKDYWKAAHLIIN